MRLCPRIDDVLSNRATGLDRMFAGSIFSDPMQANGNGWTNGQHRSQAAMDAGCLETLFVY